MKLYIVPVNILQASLPTDYVPERPLQNLTLEQLINWPGVTTSLTLRDITYTRKLVSNYGRDIVFGTESDVNLDKSTNVTATRRVSQTVSKKPGPEISKQMFDTYINAIGDAVKLVEVSMSRARELETFIKIMKDDLGDLPQLLLKSSFSRYPNRQKYMRIFDNDTEYGLKPRKHPKVILREVINPEIQFSIERCTFPNETLSTWEDDLCNFFEMIFVKKDKATLEALKQMVRKCLSFNCGICNLNFSGKYVDANWTQLNNFISFANYFQATLKNSLIRFFLFPQELCAYTTSKRTSQSTFTTKAGIVSTVADPAVNLI